MTTTELLLSHRSVRRYKEKEISQEVLERLIKCGERASNTGNMQLYSVVETRGEEERKALSQWHYGQGSTAPMYLTICADVNRYHRWCEQSGCDTPYGNLLWLLSATIDASLFAQNLCVAAEAEGLGFCYLGTVLYNAPEIGELLKLPKGVVPVITLSIGYADEEPAQSERLPLEGIVHEREYKAYSDDDIRSIHQLREEFPFNQEMVRQNGVRNLAELFTEKRYPRKQNEEISAKLEKYLKEQGFLG